MSKLSFTDLARISGGQLLAPGRDEELYYLLTDSRKLINAAGAVFFAITGSRHNGHHFLEEAYRKGIRYFVVEKEAGIKPEQFEDAGLIAVDSSIEALQKAAAWHRRQFELPLIAITGSNGKTIVKEWLGNLLSMHEQVIRSPRSYNSQIGLPLSAWLISSQHSIGIFEAGISQIGEMNRLAAILQPAIGIFTNLGTAHSEGFSSQEEKAKEKAQLFADCHTIFYCHDHTLVRQTLQMLYPEKRLLGWSRHHKEAAVFVKQEATTAQGVHITLSGAVTGTFELPFREAASVENCLHCVICYLSLGYPAEKLPQALQQLRTIAMRLELKQGVNHSYIIDDTYNNDLAGLQVALEFMQQQKQLKRRTLILSDILEAGTSPAILYRQLAMLLNNYGINRLIGIGPAISGAASSGAAISDTIHEGSTRQEKIFAQIPEARFYPDTESFLQDKPEQLIQEELVLIKGARPFSFERIVQRLQQKIHGTVLEINLDALTHNLNFYRSRLRPGTRIMVMVKAFAYGSGSHEIAQLLQFQKVDYLAVAYADEGVSLRQAGIDLPVMVMNPSPDSFDKLAEYRLEPEIYSLALLQELVHWTQANQKKISIQLKLDTGMHRLGFEKDALETTRELLLKNSRYINLSGIFSHLAGADSAEFNDFSHQQAHTFLQYTSRLTRGLPYKPLRHLVNSAGILRFPEYHFDMVRLGIGLYGAEVNRQEQDALLPVSRLKTTISQIKHIKKGDTIGYSRSGRAGKDLQLATIAIGYADGYDRRFSNGIGKVMVNGRLAPVLGKVCMDMCMIDISGIEAREGDEVLIFGPEHPITGLADSIGTIPYEILTNVGERVKRVFYTA